jgi:hypothetical protein
MPKIFQVDTAGTLTTNLVAYYNGENVNDYFSTNNLTNHNSVSFSAGKVNDGFDFGNGTVNKYVDIASNLGINTYKSGIFSWAGWVKIATAPSTNGYELIFYLNNNTQEQIHVTYIDEGGTKKICFTLYNGSSGQEIKFAQTLTIGNWYYLAFVKNGTTVKIYVNNSLIGFGTQTLTDASPGRPNLFQMGYDTFDNIANLLGVIDEIGIWNKALSPQELTDLYNGGYGQTMVDAGVGALFI